MTAKRMPTPLSYEASEAFDTIYGPDGHTVVLYWWKRAPITGPTDAQLHKEHIEHVEHMVHCTNAHDGLVEACKRAELRIAAAIKRDGPDEEDLKAWEACKNALAQAEPKGEG